MFLWLLNGIFLGILLYSHKEKQNESTLQDWSVLHSLILKTLSLLKLVLESHKDILKMASQDDTLSDCQRETILAAKTVFVDNVTDEIIELETDALQILFKNETEIDD